MMIKPIIYRTIVHYTAETFYTEVFKALKEGWPI